VECGTLKKVTVKRSSVKNVPGDKVLSDLRALIIDARKKVAQTVNAELTLLYRHIGRRIRQDILRKKRADYGKEIVAAVGRQLESEFGRDLSVKDLHRMVQFGQVFLMKRLAPHCAHRAHFVRGKEGGDRSPAGHGRQGHQRGLLLDRGIA
jgi:hypothetical protein